MFSSMTPYLKIPSAARELVMPASGIFIGALGGILAVVFRWLISFFQWVIYAQKGDLSLIVQELPWWQVILGPVIGGAVVGPLVYFVATETKGSGIPEVMKAAALDRGFIRKRVVIVKTVAASLFLGSGGSVGQEGPIVQIGSAVGSALGQSLRFPEAQMRVLVGCGAAAGIAALFNAPIAGAIFALEVILADFTVATFTPIVLAAVVASVVANNLLGEAPELRIPYYSLKSVWELGLYCGLGLVAGLVSSFFIRSLYTVQEIWDRVQVPAYAKAALGGVIVGSMGLIVPDVLGGGYEVIERTIVDPRNWVALVILVPAKIVATSISIGSGGAGGVFAPCLYVGAMAGGAYGVAVHSLFPQWTADPGGYAVVGMAALVAGTTHAPIQAILILFELTQNYLIMGPLMVSCVLAAVVARRMDRESIFTKSLVRRGIDIQAGRDANLLKGLRVRDHMTSNPETISERTKLRQLIEILPNSQHTSFPVIDAHGGLVGMLSFRDFRKVVFEDSLLDLIVARELATVPAIAVTTEDHLADALALMNENGIERLPVITAEDPSKRVVGILSQRDVISAYNKALEARGIMERISLGK